MPRREVRRRGGADRSVSRRGMPRGSLRRRLTVAFVLAAALSAGALAAVSFLLVRQARLDDSLTRGERQARTDLLLATGLQFSAGGSGPQQFVSGFAQRRVDAILVVGEQRYASNSRLNPPIPKDLRELARTGHLAYRRIGVGGAPYLIVGGRPSGSDVELYFLSSESELRRDIRTLGTVLLAGWGAIVLLAGLVGRGLARRTLAPVAEASRASRSIAEGLLATRLPVESNDEFGNWAASFNEMADALQAKIQALSEAEARERQFTADVSHELRTPLTALIGAAGLLREHLDRMPEEARRPAELVIEDLGRLRRLVDELMEISRLDAGGDPVRLEVVRLRAFVEALLRDRGWRSEVSLDGPGLSLATDPRRLRRIVDNLVGNAVTHAGSGVAVRIGRSGGDAILEVSDDGSGIAAQDLPRVFDRFFKADPARTRSGSGLGLAIARENARLLGGEIEVWSEPGKGARFTLRLPIAEPLTDVELLPDAGVVVQGPPGDVVAELLPGGDAAVTRESEHEAQEREKGEAT